ncbi:MAG: hypothetical protein V3S71_02745 [Acidobacteriota bacterium]
METTYRITKYDAAHGCDVMLTVKSSWTLHADKAATFSFADALWNLGYALMHSPTAVISEA